MTCGDRVYYIDHQARGSNRWRRGIVLQRKADYIYSSGIHRSHMRREFLKNDDFQNPEMEKPVEFEIKDYDTAVENSKYPQTEIRKPEQTPEIKKFPWPSLNCNQT